MAPTSIEFGATPLVVRRSEAVVAEKHMDRHHKLLKYVTGLVAKTCPKYLVNHEDDVVQTVLIRLAGKIDETVEKIERCRRLIREGGRESAPEIAVTLRLCLAEVEKAWDRAGSKMVKDRLQSCLAWVREEDRRLSLDGVLRKLEDCVGWLHDADGKEVFSKVYIYKGVHWAILDARKKLMRLAEVSPEEREDGSSDWDRLLHGVVPGPRSMVLREAITDCLRGLDEPKRQPTFLALLGYEYGEIAKFFDLSLPQADSRIRRGKAFLRRCLILKGVSP